MQMQLFTTKTAKKYRKKIFRLYEEMPLKDKSYVITSGKEYIDIDAYAAMVAYRELLKALKFTDVYAVSSAKMNSSIPAIIRNLDYSLDDPVIASKARNVVILDISNPDFIDNLVSEKSVVEVIDHHTGFEEYWKRKHGIKTQIEFIGSVCTIIYERFKSSDKLNVLDSDLCKLLSSGILDNTLNLQASITTERDIEAYHSLLKIGKLQNDWAKQYFMACEKDKISDIGSAIKNDLKIECVSPFIPEVFGQILLYNADKVSHQMLGKTLSEYDDWIVNAISLDDGKSYIYCSDSEVLENLKLFLGGEVAQKNLLVLDNFLLRKEIMKKAREHTDP